MIDARRGVLYPARMPEFHRIAPPSAAVDLVQWFWIPQWDIDPGRTSRQHVVSYPALNLVVEPRGIELVGASTVATYRDLIGRGWAVGAMLKPAAVAALTDEPSALRDASRAFDAPDLHRDVVRAMRDGGERGRGRAVAVFSEWLIARVGALSPAARDANRAAELLMTDAEVIRDEDAATRLSVSVRTMQRLTRRYVGLSPAAMIRRRRLQEAVQRVRDHPDTDLATLAADLGYADHAHLTNDFRTVLGFTPSSYRADSGTASTL
ncbi:helix-turn-helix domain-containing protein [Microbacterium sp. M28]|uniref:AraC family transcriptional regulator n=1 Tax=Microbacterium sp. M28 TaxID=2962064 RepID=UPI0021F4EE6F|nr:helix-turn-helix domain-containing protein [Microbacterium sp. M28]UYO97998.1 helix-turn-helix domain-containing protein [Microbacterium sp. M28]